MFVKLKLLETRPIMGCWRAEAAAVRPGSWLAMVKARTRQAIAGASQRSDKPEDSAAEPKSFRLMLGEGRRGCQERNWFSSRFISFSFIIFSFHAEFQFLKAVTVSPGGGVGGDIQKFANFFESPALPDFEHNDFALLHRQIRQVPHGGAFGGRFLVVAFKPAPGLQLARQPPPKRTAVIQGPIAKAAHAVMLQLGRTLALLHQSDKGLVQNVLRLGMTQPERAAVKY